MKSPTQNQRRRKLEKCAFWRVRSIHVLARLLKTPVDELRVLSEAGARNYCQYEDRKKPGKTRWIEAPRPKLKAVQRRIHKLLGRLEPPSFLFSGFHGRSAVTNAFVHELEAPMVQLDIRKFYPSSDGRRVFKFFFEDLSCSKDIADILWKICTIPDRSKPWMSHLPTGGVTSPIMAYFAYMDMFDELESLAQRDGITFTALADDVTFSGLNSGWPTLISAEQIIQNYGLRSHWRKRKVHPASYPKKIVTGVHITANGYRVPFEQKEKISVLWEAVSKENDSKKRMQIYQRLCGSLSAAAQVEPKFRQVAKIKMAEWKSDHPAWNAHSLVSGGRRWPI